MKKNIFTIMLLISSTCINTFAEMKTDNNSTYTEDIPIPIKKPIRKSIHQLYIIGYLENGAYTFTFNKALPNAEIKIYRNGFLVEYYCGSFNLGQVYTTNQIGCQPPCAKFFQKNLPPKSRVPYRICSDFYFVLPFYSPWRPPICQPPL